MLGLQHVVDSNARHCRARHCAGRFGCLSAPLNPNPQTIMPRNLYTPRLSDDVVRALYREALRRRQPMTVVADTLLRQSLGRIANDPPLLRVCEDPPQYGAKDNPEAA